MKRVFTYFIVSFFAVTAVADEIDAEIIKHLDFFEKMPVVEDLDLIELEEQTHAPAQTADAGASKKKDQDSLDDVVQGGGQ
jgi:hypothetical protein